MKIFIVILFSLISIGLFAKKTEKKILSTDDFAQWKIIQNAQISNDGEFVCYELNPQRGDGDLILKYIDSKDVDTIPRAYGTKISPENDFLVFKIKQPLDSIRQAKLDKIEKDKMPQDSLGILIFRQHQIFKFPKLKSYKIPEENAGWVAFLAEVSEIEKKDVTDMKEDQEEEKQKEKDPKNEKSKNLVLFNVKNADTIQITGVTDYVFAKKGHSVAIIQETGDSVKTCKVLIFDTEVKQLKEVFSEEGTVKKISLDEAGDQYAFLFSNDTIDEKTYHLFYGRKRSGKTDALVDERFPGMPIGWAPSENANLVFSEDGKMLYFGTAHKPEKEPKDTLIAEEKVKLDIWNWQDKRLQSQQKVELEKDKKITYSAVYNFAEKSFVQLADPIVKEIKFDKKRNDTFVLGIDESPYQRATSWSGKWNADYYLVDVKTGIKRIMLKNMSRVWLSPQTNYIVWYNPADSCYYSQSTSMVDQKVNNLTQSIPVNFYDELNDVPNDPSPYGIVGWGKEDRYVYIYDRYDIWKVDLSTLKVPVNVTRGFGRRNKLQLRFVQFDKDLEYIDTEARNVVKAFDERNKSGGFFEVDFKNFKEPKMLIAENVKFGFPIKTKNSDDIIFTKESYDEYPNYWASNTEFSHPKKITEANPQQKDFNWCITTMIDWTSFAGDTLKGLLYMPGDFDPGKKYPLMVYYYERNSDNLYSYTIPSPSRSIINKSYYASNGYMIFVPDIVYRDGYPGQSAYDAIVSGVSYLTNNFRFVDASKIGLQGQSWGGYQTAYLITQTDMFTAAMAGAPVSNMTSAYGGIRWQSGLSRMFQYEHTQSRIGGTLWEKPMQYIENSPLFYAPKVNTPLLMMHNDNDGAVPWYQGIEFFVALRRLDKPVWMLSYNGEPHNLKRESWGNRMDLSIRMKAFFDHYLMDKPMPEWMKYGIPAIEKGKILGY